MTGFDGLVEAQSNQISDLVKRTQSKLIPGEGRKERSTTTFETIVSKLAMGEEVIAKAIGNVVSDSRKYDFSEGVGNYHSQVGFADLFRDTGMDPTFAAILGIGAALVNPADPLNKVKILGLTKVGKAAEAVASAGDNLVKGSDDIWRIATDKLTKDILDKKKALETGQYAKGVDTLAQRSVTRQEETLRNVTELNGLMEELQKRGATINEMKLAGSTYEQVRQGQRHLIGFSSPFKLDHLSLFGVGRGQLDNASVVGVSGPRTAAIIKGTTSLKNVVVKPLSDAAYKVADYLNIPTARTQAAKDTATLIKRVLNETGAAKEDVERNLQGIYTNFIKQYGKGGEAAAKQDLLAIIQALEHRHSGVKEMAIAELDKLADYTAPIPRGVDVTVESGGGLSDEQKLRLTQSGVGDIEIPTAISQFEQANVPSMRIGVHKQHEVKLLGRYVVVKTSDPATALSELKDLEGIYGNRVWAKHQDERGTFLIQKRHPGASRITKTSDFEVSHLQNLESIAAQLGTKKKALVNVKPEDILVSPTGAVQIINPSVIAEFKTAKDALANSRMSLEALADELGIAKGYGWQFNSLKSVKAARMVPRGVDGMTFRVARANEVSDDLVYVSGHDLLEQSLNTGAHKNYVRASYDQVTPQELAQQLGDPAEFERANNIEYHREQIRKSIKEGLEPQIEPIAVGVDDTGNQFIISGRDRLTATLLEGYEAVPVHRKNLIGDVVEVEKGFYSGKTAKLVDTWDASTDSSAVRLTEDTRGIVSPDYSLINSAGEVLKLSPQQVDVDARLAGLLNRIITLGPQFVGKARTQRIDSALSILSKNNGSLRNSLLRIAEIAEQSPDAGTFIAQVEKLLVNPKTKQGIRLDNTLRHPQLEELFMQFKNLSTKNLDDLAVSGVFTNYTIRDTRRLLLASDRTDLVVQVLDREKNTLRVFSNQATTAHLETVAKGFLNKTTTAADIEPYARVNLVGVDGNKTMEVRDFVDVAHPRLADVTEPVKVFQISKEQSRLLKKEGIFVTDAKNVEVIKEELSKRGLNFGVLLSEKEVTSRYIKTGQFAAGAKEKVIIRPEFTFFVTRSGSLVIGTKHDNVKDLLHSVFGEGPAYFEEFGVMTTGKVIISNPFGSKMQKIGIGEMRVLQNRLKELATRFKELGLSDGTVMDIRVPFDDAVWRSMYGERVTIGQILDDKFKLGIPDGLKDHVPDIRVLAPGRYGADAQELGVVGIERTRLANAKMQELFETLENYADKAFLDTAKSGLPISYYSSWFGRALTQKAKEALNEAWLKNPDKQASTFKNLESFFKGRVFTDLTTQEVNSVIKRLQKEGVENADSIISDVVKKYRDGYVLKPTKEVAASLVAISKILPEGIDFFHLDPIWSTALSMRAAQRAIGRKAVVDGLKDMSITVWHGSVKELEEIRLKKHPKFLAVEKEVNRIDADLTQAKLDLERLSSYTPDLKATTAKAELQQKIDSLTVKLADAQVQRSHLVEKVGTGKVLDTMVDLDSETVWIRGEDLTRLIDNGIIDNADVIGDSSDALVRLPIKKYSSLLDENDAEIFLFPKEVAGAVQRYFFTTTKEGASKFLQVWDTVQSLWRNWTLFPIPAYHFRNAISNTFMAYLGGVSDPRAYRETFAIFKIIDGHRKGQLSVKQVQEALNAMSFTSVSGKTVTAQTFYDEFVRHGGLSGGLHKNEFTAFGTVARASEFERLTTKAGLRDSSEVAGSWLFDNAALRGGISLASFVENRFRMATFLDAFLKGRTEVKNGLVISGFEAAAIHMKRVFYDYSDLSAFERSWLRRAIPFYSWSRFNIPRMLTTLMTDPVKHYRMAEFFSEVETGAVNGPVDENTLPEWVRKRYGLVVEKTKQGNYIVKTGDGFLPMIDAYKILSGDGIFNMIKDGITPFVKLPLEQLFNYSTYSQRPIEQVPGQRSSSWSMAQAGFSKRATTEGPLGVLNLILNESVFRTFFRPGGELSTKVIDPIFDGKEGPSIKLAVFGFFIGKAYEINPRQTRMAIFRNWSSRQRQLMQLRENAQEQGDFKSVEDADRMMTWLRLQYPGEKEL